MTGEPLTAVSGRWRARLAGLSLGPAFDRLWAGMAVSQMGSQVGFLAISLTGAVTLQATAAQMAALSVVARLPFLAYPVAGVVADRLPRRPVMIAADLARAGLLLTIPAAALLGALRMELLYAVLLLLMALSVGFDTASQAFVPLAVESDRLATAYGRVATSASAARVAGPGLGGLVVQVLTAPFAVLLDAASFLFSALMVWLARPGQPAPARPARELSFISDMAEGFRYVAGQPVLRSLALASGVLQFAGAALMAVYLLYLTRDLGLVPASVGLAMSGTGPGTLLGAALASRAGAGLGAGRALLAGWLCFAAGGLLIPLAPAGAPLFVAGQLAVAGFLMGLGGQVSGVIGVTLSQAIAPDELRGRVSGGLGFLSLGVAPFGALLGGLVGSVGTLRGATLVAGLLMLAVPALAWLTPIRGLREPPAAPGRPAR